jgi:hypothetical protein
MTFGLEVGFFVAFQRSSVSVRLSASREAQFVVGHPFRAAIRLKPMAALLQ